MKCHKSMCFIEIWLVFIKGSLIFSYVQIPVGWGSPIPKSVWGVFLPIPIPTEEKPRTRDPEWGSSRGDLHQIGIFDIATVETTLMALHNFWRVPDDIGINH